MKLSTKLQFFFAGGGIIPIPPSFDEDAKTYITRVEDADGQTLETGVRSAINDFVVGVKADGGWATLQDSPLKASCILAGARTLNGALEPLVGTAPTNFNFVQEDYNRKTGLATDGATKYIDTNFSATSVPQNSAHMSIYKTGAANSFAIYNKIADGSWAIDPGGGGFRAEINGSDSGFNGTNAGPINGFIAANRADPVNYTYRFNGTTGTFSRSSSSPIADTILLFARRNPSVEIVTMDGARKAFYSIGEDINLTNLDARVSAFISALNTAI